jgi:hypothetical protein
MVIRVQSDARRLVAILPANRNGIVVLDWIGSRIVPPFKTGEKNMSEPRVRFDYDRQAWLRDSGNGFRFIRCGHPDEMQCGCFGRTFEGFTVEDADDILAQAKHIQERS